MKAIIFVNPHNPTGTVYSRDVLQTVLQFANRYTWIAKTLGSTSITHRSDAKVSDRFLINVDPRVFAIGVPIDTLRPRQNCCHFADDILRSIVLYKNARISLKFSLKCVLKVRIDNIPALIQIMTWCRPGDTPLSETMMIDLQTHLCVTRRQ